MCTGTTTKMWVHQTFELSDFVCAERAADKVLGLGPDEMDLVYRDRRPDLLVVEADGSRGKVVKAPAAHEPVIPSTSTHVLSLLGADCLNRVIEDVAHRPMLAAAICGCGPYERLTIERAAKLMTSSRGGRQGVPPTARHVVVLTRVGSRQIAYAEEFIERLHTLGTECIALPLIEAD